MAQCYFSTKFDLLGQGVPETRKKHNCKPQVNASTVLVLRVELIIREPYAISRTASLSTTENSDIS